MSRAPTYTVAGPGVAALLAYVRSRGVDLTARLAEIGLRGVDLSQPETRIESTVNDALWSLAASALKDEDLGLRFAQRLDLDGFHVVGHLAASSATVGQALERVVRFSRLLHDAGRTEVERNHDGQVLLFPGCRGLPTPPPRQVAEFNTASAVVLLRFVTGEPRWAPRAVQFQHLAPRAVATHRQVLGVAPRFGAAEDVVVLDEADLLRPVRVSAASRLGQYLEAYAQTLVERLPASADDLRGQVLRAIVSGLSAGGVTVTEVAARLAMTPRTLQRRLAERGDAFSALVEEARRGAAQHYLRNPSLPLGEISFLLGFHDPSTFHKAFRRWTGHSPGAWRAKHLAP